MSGKASAVEALECDGGFVQTLNKGGRPTTTGVRTLAKLTGRSVGSIHADMKRAQVIGSGNLVLISGTSIDNGVGLDAMVKASADQRTAVMSAVVRERNGEKGAAAIALRAVQQGQKVKTPVQEAHDLAARFQQLMVECDQLSARDDLSPDDALEVMACLLPWFMKAGSSD